MNYELRIMNYELWINLNPKLLADIADTTRGNEMGGGEDTDGREFRLMLGNPTGEGTRRDPGGTGQFGFVHATHRSRNIGFIFTAQRYGIFHTFPIAETGRIAPNNADTSNRRKNTDSQEAWGGNFAAANEAYGAN